MALLASLDSMLAVFGMVLQQPTPPPPPESGFEFLTNVARTHAETVKCGTTQTYLRWSFDGNIARFKTVRLLDHMIKRSDLAELNGWASELQDDVMLRVDCDGSGLSMDLIGAQSAESERAAIIRLNYANGKLWLVRRFGFPVEKALPAK